MAGAKLSVADACAYLGGISRRTFYAHVRPYVPAITLGARIVFDADDLDAFAERQKVLNAPTPAPRGPVNFGPGRRKWKVGKDGELVRVEQEK